MCTNLRIYGNVTNLATITGYSGLTPDVNVTGLQAGIRRRGSLSHHPVPSRLALILDSN